jgi:hypothetical protein
MRFFILICITIFGIHHWELAAQKLSTNLGSASSGMGGTGVASDDLWGAANNQASLGFNQEWGAGFYYENRYLSKALSLNALTLVMPLGKGSFATNISYFGYSQYNEKKIGFAYGMPLSKRLAFGVQLDYLHTAIGEQYGGIGLVTFEAGLLYEISSKVKLGAHVFNPVQAKLNDYNDERLPMLLKMGLNWTLSEDFMAAVEVQSDIDHDLVFRVGLQYAIGETLYTRIGMSNNPNTFTFGVGLKMEDFTLDFSSSMHQVLGYSPQIGLHYQIKKR